MIAFLLLLAAATGPAAHDERLARLAAVYDAVCLRAFPDDAAVAGAMTAVGAIPMTPAAVKVTLRDDPGHGWQFRDDGVKVLVIIEEPPYHACSVRWTTPAADDLADYRIVADRFEAAKGDFVPLAPIDTDRDDFHIHATGEVRRTPGESVEALFVITQQVTDPQRRAAGATGTDLRFVHQLSDPSLK